jgi:hypothetical protein
LSLLFGDADDLALSEVVRPLATSPSRCASTRCCKVYDEFPSSSPLRKASG